MKKIQYGVILIFCLYSLTGCNKDTPDIHPVGNNNITNSLNTGTLEPGLYHLNIFNWITSSSSGVFTYNVGTMKMPKGIPVSSQVKIYILTGAKEILINNPIPFMQGSIWCLINGLNVKIIYRNESGETYIPFTSLDIKIEIQ